VVAVAAEEAQHAVRIGQAETVAAAAGEVHDAFPALRARARVQCDNAAHVRVLGVIRDRVLLPRALLNQGGPLLHGRFAFRLVHVAVRQKHDAVARFLRHRNRGMRDHPAVIAPQRRARGRVYREHGLRSHDPFRHGAYGRFYAAPRGPGRHVAPHQARLLRILVGARVRFLVRLEETARVRALRRRPALLGCHGVGVAPVPILTHEQIPQRAVTIGQRRRHGTEDDVADARQIAPAAVGFRVLGQRIGAQGLARRGVETVTFGECGDKDAVLAENEIAHVGIDTHPDGARQGALPQLEAVIGVVGHDNVFALHEHATVLRQGRRGARMAFNHLAGTRKPEPQHAQRPAHAQVVRTRGVARFGVLVRPAARARQGPARDHMPRAARPFDAPRGEIFHLREGGGNCVVDRVRGQAQHAAARL